MISQEIYLTRGKKVTQPFASPKINWIIAEGDNFIILSYEE